MMEQPQKSIYKRLRVMILASLANIAIALYIVAGITCRLHKYYQSFADKVDCQHQVTIYVNDVNNILGSDWIYTNQGTFKADPILVHTFQRGKTYKVDIAGVQKTVYGPDGISMPVPSRIVIVYTANGPIGKTSSHGDVACGDETAAAIRRKLQIDTTTAEMLRKKLYSR